jgi:hypothetical protein
VESGHVFLSYSTADRPLAETLLRRLESKGVSVWIAPRDIPPGSDYSEAIENALDSSSAVVALISQSANASRHVKAEIEIAFSRGKPLFPVRFQDIQPARGLSLFLNLGHWTDLFGSEEAASLDRLAAELIGRSGRTVPPPAPPGAAAPIRPPPAPAPAPRRPAFSTRFLVVTIALSLVVIFAVMAVALLRKSGPAAGQGKDAATETADAERDSGTSRQRRPRGRGRGGGGSTWEHNGSILRLRAEGPRRVFVYVRPAGRVPARRDDIVFSGERSGSTYRGTAYQYSSRCGRIGYAVEGSVAPGDRQVTLRGDAPVRDDNCQIVGSRPDELIFRHVGAE